MYKLTYIRGKIRGGLLSYTGIHGRSAASHYGNSGEYPELPQHYRRSEMEAALAPMQELAMLSLSKRVILSTLTSTGPAVSDT